MAALVSHYESKGSLSHKERSLTKKRVMSESANDGDVIGNDSVESKEVKCKG